MGGRVRTVEQLRLAQLPVDLLAQLGYAEVAEHVLHGSRNSPFISWTRSPRMATWYALNGGRRKRGLVFSATLHLRRRSWWMNPDESWSVAFHDARGRRLIPTAGFGALTARAASCPEEIAAIRALGSSDQEYLLMGRIEPHEMVLQHVQQVANHQHFAR